MQTAAVVCTVALVVLRWSCCAGRNGVHTTVRVRVRDRVRVRA
jgi:hypothetical protein